MLSKETDNQDMMRRNEQDKETENKKTTYIVAFAIGKNKNK